MLKQLSVFIENEPGSLCRVTSVLNRNNVNIRAVASFDTPEFAILRLVVDQPEKGKEKLTEEGFIVRISDVIAVELEDQQGNLDKMLGILSEGNISISYIYTFVIRDQENPAMVFYTEDMEEAVQILKKHSIKVVD